MAHTAPGDHPDGPGYQPATPAQQSSQAEPGNSSRHAQALDRLPGRLLVYAVEAAGIGLGPGLSPRVAAAVGPLIQRIEEDIRRSDRAVIGDLTAGSPDLGLLNEAGRSLPRGKSPPFLPTAEAAHSGIVDTNPSVLRPTGY